MFGSIAKSNGLLFVTYDLQSGLQKSAESLRAEIESLDSNRLLNTAPEDLKKYLAEKYRVEPVKLLREHWEAEVIETQIDVRHDQMRMVMDRGRPVLVPGERVVVRVPFEGDPELFYNRSNTYSTNPPRATIEGNNLVLKYESPADSPRDVRPLVDRELATIEEHLGWQRSMIEGHNRSLANIAGEAIQKRRVRLLDQTKRADSLGIPIKRRDDAPKTYAVPTVRRKAAPTLPPASSAQFTPEPAWAIEQYEQALKIMQDMALVMERSPAAFKAMDEEALRTHFLVQLNGQFEGKATGETFNMEGKTDILLREGDRNVFITECKFWKGPKGFGEAIDQLLGYATWRDGKLAIVVFNRGVEMSTVLAGIDSTVKAHSNFKRGVTWPHESGFRYVLHANGDANREMILTVLVFHVPK
ncbi:hypothetical protein [Herbaspirillum huttiense]|uniref:Uncharacterized protein n=2 Tax=Herbaspirillum huttiense TaxID=863372 RepID=A0AAJ2HBP3_9BURK|nr:hypothetical protein [Herbaspirillum huttiense]MDR9837642.1 hypothetical protein [Herbaspirillum huttiense]